MSFCVRWYYIQVSYKGDHGSVSVCVVSSSDADGAVPAVHADERSPIQSVCNEASVRARHLQFHSQPGHPKCSRRRRAQSVGDRVQTLGGVPAVRPGQATPAGLHLPRGPTLPKRRHVGNAASLSAASVAAADDRGLLQQVPRDDVQEPRGSTLQGALRLQ